MEDLNETELLAALPVQRALRDKLQIDEPRLIAAARRENITWSRLAPALEVRSRQPAERRYLQLPQDIDSLIGHPLTQGDRVEAAHTQRNRRAEQHWALQHDAEIIAMARRLAALADLQQRADSCSKVTHANQVAAIQCSATARATRPPCAPPGRTSSSKRSRHKKITTRPRLPCGNAPPTPATNVRSRHPHP